MTTRRGTTTWFRFRFAVVSLALMQLVSVASAQTEYENCALALLNSDITGNNRLNNDPEYLTFLNELSGFQYGFSAYDKLPSSLQMNFQIFQESDGEIDISGVSRGDDATDQQRRIVETLCKTTAVALADIPVPERASSSISNTTRPFLNATTEVPLSSNGTSAPNQTDDVPEAETEAPSRYDMNEAFVTRPPSIKNGTELKPGANITQDTEDIQPPTSTTPSPSTGLNDTVAFNQTTEDDEPVVNATSEPSTAYATEAPTDSPRVPASNLTQSSNETAAAAEEDDDDDTTLTALTQDPYATCKLVMRFSDINADGTMNKLEYVWFINDNWDNPFPGVAFKNLPPGLKDNFNKLTTGGAIDVSALNSEEEMSEEQEAFLDRVCADTEAALAIEPEDSNAGEVATMATFKDCLASVTMFDENSDSSLDANEYLSLVNELSDDKFGKQGFNYMPAVLQETFYALAVSGSIDLGGARHGKKLKSSQQEVLEETCIEVSYALDEAAQGPGEEQGAKFDGADTDTMLEYASCFLGLNAYDKDGDSVLDQIEYVGLANHLGQNGFQDLGFSELPEVLQDNFFNLEKNGTIAISGSRTDQAPDSAQSHFLGRVCIETTAAVNMGLKYSTGSDGGIPYDTVAIEPIVIHSSFNVFSDVWIPEEEFTTGTTRETLDEAYKIFIAEVLEGLIQEGSNQGSPRRLLKEVSYDPESPAIYHIMDLNCAGGTQTSICKTVFAQYEITVGEGTDRQALYEEYVSVTQGFIDSGLLQRDMERIDPNFLVTVIGASEPVAFKGEDSTQSPVNSVPLYAEEEANDGSGSSKKTTIALVAVAVGCLLLGSLVGLFYARWKKGQQASSVGTLAGRSSGKASDTDSKVDDEDEFNQEGSQGSQSTPKSNIFRTRGGDTDSDEDAPDEELVRMQVVDLVNGDVEEGQGSILSSASSYSKSDSQSARSFPPLWKKKKKPAGEISRAASEELSFAFRRYALDGNKKKRNEDRNEI